MAHRVSRRKMLRSVTAAGVGYWVAGSAKQAYPSNSANEQLNIAVIGVGGRGRANLQSVGGENIVAMCDVDDQRAGDAYEQFSRAEKFYDYRRMFDKLANSIDAVVVSTPDHSHFPASMIALELGKHLYCEKPMAHNVWECRRMTDFAREKKVATQLGVQRHTISNVHRVVELIQSGAIGEVREAHAWVDGERGMPGNPQEYPQVPPHLKWDLWIGPAEERQYSSAFCPYDWRWWWNFGTGETGNWGCHILDIPFWALDLKYPTHVRATGPEVDPEQTSKSMAVQLEFPARGERPPVTLHWYHSKDGPQIYDDLGIDVFGNTLFVGSKGILVSDFQAHKLYPEEQFQDFKYPQPSVPDSPGFHPEWLAAAKGGEPATCQFDYSGPLTEALLLGNVAYRSGEAFEWDAPNLRASSPKAQAFIRRSYRKGWEMS